MKIKSGTGPLELLIEKLIKLAKRIHYWNDEDSWYSCPLSEGGSCKDTIDQTKCSCGANKHNKEVDEIEKEIKKILN